jgi:nucleoside-diphosphate-sugar epimerase
MNGGFSRVLVTGAQGFVGRYLVRALLSHSPRTLVLGLGRSTRQDEFFTHAITLRGQVVVAPLPPDMRECLTDRRYQYVVADIERERDLALALADFRPQIVFHLASALRDESPTRLLACNVQGAINLLSAVAHSAMSGTRVVLGSSAAVYGNVAAADLPVRESYPVDPVGMYGVSKHAAELAARALATAHGLDLVTARLFNLVGPGQEERHVCAQLVSQLARPSTETSPPTVRIGRLDTTRDFVDVRDAAQALILLAERGLPGQTYNIASGSETSIREILDHCLSLIPVADCPRVEVAAGREGDVLRSVADVNQLHELGFQTRYGIRESLCDLLDYYRDVTALQLPAAESRTMFPHAGPMQQLPPYASSQEALVAPAVLQDAPHNSIDGFRPTGVRQ